MGKIKYLSLFSGIGAFETALKKVGVNFDLIGFSEIDKEAVKSYCAIHGIDETLNLGDITKINTDELPAEIDLITHGSPCQDFSKEGKHAGGDEGSNTRSSLMWNTLEIVSETLPKYVIWENVPEAYSKKHKHNVEKYISELDKLGYNNYLDILCALDYSIPQNRKRLFVVSVRKEIDKGFCFPVKTGLDKELIDYLDENVDEKYYINAETEKALVIGRVCDKILVKNATKKGYAEAFDGDGIDFNYPNSKTRRGRVQDRRCHTLKTSNNVGVFINGRLRKFTSREMWKLMGFSVEDYEKAVSIGTKETSLVKQAGNSIVVDVAEAIIKALEIE